MRDNELIQLFVPIIDTGLIDRGFVGVETIASYQPTQQGAPSAPTVFFYKLGEER